MNGRTIKTHTPISNGKSMRNEGNADMPNRSLIFNGRTIKTQTLIANGKSLKEERKKTIIVDMKEGASLISNGRTIKTHTLISNSKSVKGGEKEPNERLIMNGRTVTKEEREKTIIRKIIKVVSNHNPRKIVDMKGGQV